MTYSFQFVDSIQASPTVRLDLMAAPWSVLVEGTSFPPPQLRRAVVSTLLTDGELIPAAAYGNRTITLNLHITAATDDDCATAVQNLARELDRPKNYLRYQLGTSTPVFFRTFRADYTAIQWDPANPRVATISIPAEPFACGPKETLASVTVNNDPAAASNGCFFDIAGIKGDVETPLILRAPKSWLAGGTTALGVRRRGTVSALPLFRQVESLSMTGSDMTVVADSSASGGNLGRVAFSTTGWSDRAWGPMTTAAGSTDIRGTYRVFVRARHSVASDAISVRLVWGYNSTSLAVTNTAVALNTSGTYWQVYDLGLMQAPYGSDPTTDGYSGVDVAVMPPTVFVQATRTSGTGTLDLDYLLFVPADDELMLLTWPGDTGDLESFVFDGAHEVVYGMKTSVSPAQIVPTNAAQIVGDFPMVSPTVTNRIAMSIITAGDGYLPAAVTLTPEYYPRYLYVRPPTT